MGGQGKISRLLHITFKSSATLSYVVRNLVPNISNDRVAIMSFATSVTIYPTTQPNIPEDFNLKQHHCENLIFCITFHHFSTFAFPVQPNFIFSPVIKCYYFVGSSTLLISQGLYSLYDAAHIRLSCDLVWTPPLLQKCPQHHNSTR
jgi:hypothetical protein